MFMSMGLRISAAGHGTSSFGRMVEGRLSLAICCHGKGLRRDDAKFGFRAILRNIFRNNLAK